jgi:hypothetical protein
MAFADKPVSSRILLIVKVIIFALQPILVLTLSDILVMKELFLTQEFQLAIGTMMFQMQKKGVVGLCNLKILLK